MDSNKQPSRLLAWAEFHRDNPAVFEMFRKFSAEIKAAGASIFSARAVWERLRWQVFIETRSTGTYKLNNDYVSYYSRLLMLLHPEFEGFFEIRDGRFEGTPEELLNAHHHPPRRVEEFPEPPADGPPRFREHLLFN